MPHPQYLGTTLTYFAGWWLLLSSNLSVDYFKVFAAGIGFSYWAMSTVEQYSIAVRGPTRGLENYNRRPPGPTNV
ncbi:hypothetical protein TrRE_jg9854 [Triparma retinervis]|uniref:Uncharacterized protein n=1 Tax=Triparma retinervis TaxID=2557542 RepID=A0A9W7DN07_9STRA|nr:hypothetical protein TrRE_jg9854 [Triparma retinervis]